MKKYPKKINIQINVTAGDKYGEEYKGKIFINWFARVNGKPYGDYIRLDEGAQSPENIAEAAELITRQAAATIRVITNQA